MPRRTFLRGRGRHDGVCRCWKRWFPPRRRWPKPPANPVRRLGFVFMPMGCDITRWTPPGDTLDELSPILSSLAPGQGTRHGDHQSGVAKRLSRQPCDFQLRLPQRRQGEADGKHGLLPGHHGRSDRRQANRPGNAIAVAGAGDGPAADGRPVRQRLRLRLSEQSFLVLAHDAAAGGGASAHRF